MGRFSDEALAELQDSFTDHARKLDDHVDRFDAHVVRFDEHVVEEHARWGNLADMVRQNTIATERLAVAIERQAESTAGVLQLYADMQSTKRIGGAAGRFLVWLAATGAAGSAIVGGLLWLVNRAP